MFTIEGLTKQIAAYVKQRADTQQLVHHFSGAIQLLEGQVKMLSDAAEAAAKATAEEAAKAAASLAKQEAAKAIDGVLPGAGEAIVDAAAAALTTQGEMQPS